MRKHKTTAAHHRCGGVDCPRRSDANEQPSLSPSFLLPSLALRSTLYPPTPPPPLHPLPPTTTTTFLFLMFRIQPPICSTSPYLIVQNDTLTFYGEPIILSYTVHWLCEPTCPDQLGSAREWEAAAAVVRVVVRVVVEVVVGSGVAGRLIALSLTPPLGRSEQLETEPERHRGVGCGRGAGGEGEVGGRAGRGCGGC